MFPWALGVDPPEVLRKTLKGIIEGLFHITPNGYT